MRRRFVLAGLVLSCTLACHQAAPGSPGSSRPDLITREQIEASNAANVYDLIARLRPEFLKDRGSISIKTNQHERAVVFLNDQEYGILETLRNFAPSRVEEIRYVSGIDAVARFGSRYGGGVVMLISRRE